MTRTKQNAIVRELERMPVEDRVPTYIHHSLASAESSCRRWNQYRTRAVIVEGPSDGEHTVMDMADATENELMYIWVAQ